MKVVVGWIILYDTVLYHKIFIIWLNIIQIGWKYSCIIFLHSHPSCKFEWGRTNFPSILDNGNQPLYLKLALCFTQIKGTWTIKVALTSSSIRNLWFSFSINSVECISYKMLHIAKFGNDKTTLWQKIIKMQPSKVTCSKN